MKTLLSVLFFVLLTCSNAKHLLKMNLRATPLTDKASYEAYAQANLIDQIPVVKNAKGADELDPNTNVSIFEGKSIPDEKAPREIQWEHVLQNFSTTDIPTLRKFQFLRYLEVFNALRGVLSDKTKFQKCANYPEWKLEGNIREFNTGCVKVIHNADGNVFSEGKITVINAGSHTLVSDVDYNMDFVPMTSTGKVTIYDKLRTLGTIINRVNKDFGRTHINSLNDSYNANYYSKSFGYAELLQILKKISTDNYNYRKFKSGNRLAVLMLIFNDAVKLMKQHNQAINVEESTARIRITEMMRDAYICGNIIAPDTPSEDSIFAIRNDDEAYRNAQMGLHILKAGESKSDLEVLCNMVSANFNALEGYVPVGAMIDIFLLQGIVPNEAEFKEFYDKIDPDFIEDAILMNFAYAVEHFYKHHEEPFEAIRRFSKYTSRMYRVLKKFPENDQKKCWQGAFDKLALADNNAALKKTVYDLAAVKEVAAALTKKANELGDAQAFKWVESFYKDGFACVNKYDLQL
jgi:hypothetical protein